MALLFKSKKKKENNDSKKPTEPPKPEPKNNPINEEATPKETQKPDKTVEVKDSVNDKISLNVPQEQEAKAQDKQKVSSLAEFNIEDELKALESKLVGGKTDKNSEKDTSFEGLFKSTPKTEANEQRIEEQTYDKGSVVLYSSKEGSYFIKDSDLQRLIEQVNEILTLNNSLEEHLRYIHSLVSKNKEKVEKMLRDGDFMFNKSIKCDAIIRGENNG